MRIVHLSDLHLMRGPWRPSPPRTSPRRSAGLWRSGRGRIASSSPATWPTPGIWTSTPPCGPSCGHARCPCTWRPATTTGRAHRQVRRHAIPRPWCVVRLRRGVPAGHAGGGQLLAARQPAGYLGQDQLAWIDKALGARPDVPAFVCVHHPPLPVGIPFLDGMILDDGPQLADVIVKHPYVIRVLAGHVHRDVSALFAGTLMTAAPSTYRQSALRLHDAEPPGSVAEPTGFLLHMLDGPRCVTHSVASSHAAAVSAF